MEDKNLSINTKKNPYGSRSSNVKGGMAGRISSRVVTWLLTGALLVGVGLIAYPTVADYWNSFHQTRSIATYAEEVSNMNQDDYKSILDEARAYNERLAEKGITWILSDEEKKEYESILDISGTGIMGYINIHKINVMLPVYHGTDEGVLQISVGHLEGSSLPVGGETSHCMLSGHRGLPSAKLFTDLDKLREGDTFTVTILNETLTYEVDHIWIVEPSELSHLEMEEGKDYCTLITCTPYGINSHRLLVRAHRVANANGDAMVVADALQIRPIFIAPFIAIPILIILLIYMLIDTGLKRRAVDSAKENYMSEKGLKDTGLGSDEQDIEKVLDDLRRFVNTRTDSKSKKSWTKQPKDRSAR